MPDDRYTQTGCCPRQMAVSTEPFGLFSNSPIEGAESDPPRWIAGVAETGSETETIAFSDTQAVERSPGGAVQSASYVFPNLYP